MRMWEKKRTERRQGAHCGYGRCSGLGWVPGPRVLLLFQADTHHRFCSSCGFSELHMTTSYKPSLHFPDQRFSTGVLQEFLKHSMPDYSVKGPDLFFFRVSNKKMTTANTVAIWYERIKVIPIFLPDRQKIYFLVCYRILVIRLCVPRDVKGWKSLL